MNIPVSIFRGQGVRVGDRYDVVHRYASPTEILIRFKEAFETIPLDQLLPASDLASVDSLVKVAYRYGESDLELQSVTS